MFKGVQSCLDGDLVQCSVVPLFAAFLVSPSWFPCGADAHLAPRLLAKAETMGTWFQRGSHGKSGLRSGLICICADGSLMPTVRYLHLLLLSHKITWTRSFDHSALRSLRGFVVQPLQTITLLPTSLPATGETINLRRTQHHGKTPTASSSDPQNTRTR